MTVCFIDSGAKQHFLYASCASYEQISKQNVQAVSKSSMVVKKNCQTGN